MYFHFQIWHSTFWFVFQIEFYLYEYKFEFSDIAAFHILRGLLLICSGVLPSVSAPIVSRRRSKSKKIKYFHGLFTTYIKILNNKNPLRNLLSPLIVSRSRRKTQFSTIKYLKDGWMVHHYYKQQKYFLTFNFWHTLTFKNRKCVQTRTHFCFAYFDAFLLCIWCDCDQAEFRSVSFSESEG